jgi:mono/diheme cytochrome c family protein
LIAGALSSALAQSDEPPLGAQLYANHCGACHGEDGEGGGPVAAVMTITVPNLRTLSRRNDGVFPADAIAAYIDGRETPAAHGDRQMPVWGDVFAAGERGGEDIVRRRIAAIVEFIAQLQYR